MTLSFKHPSQKLKNWVAFLFAGLVTINLISLLSRQSLCKCKTALPSYTLKTAAARPYLILNIPFLHPGLITLTDTVSRLSKS